MRFAPYILGILCVVGVASLARADGSPNLIVNGGFETGNFSGWTLTGNSSYSFVSGFTFGNDMPNSGTYYAMLGSYGVESYLSQTVATTPGADYTLTYYLSSDGAQQNEFSVAENGITVQDDMNIPDTGGYAVFTADFKATSASTTVSLGSRDDPSYLLLDDVSLVDPPASAPLAGSFWMGSSLMAVIGLATLLRRRSVA